MDRFTLGSRYYYSRLSSYEKQVYRDIYDCWATGDCIARILLPGSEFKLPSGVDLHQIVTYIIEENPHLFHLETTQFTYNRLGSEVSIRAENVYSRNEYKDIYRKLISRVSNITEKAKQYGTDYDRLLFLHDYLAENLTYDTGLPNARSQREIHTVVGALLNSACVCDGFARAFRLLCDQLHISCIVAVGQSTQSGNSGPHAWNFVKLGNRVFHVDVTWDSGLFANNCPITDYYFLRNDAVFSKDHAWDSSLYPPITFDYPRKEKAVFSKWELEQHLCDKVTAGCKRVLVQFSDDFPGADVLQGLLSEILMRNAHVFQHIRRFKSTFDESIKCAEIDFF